MVTGHIAAALVARARYPRAEIVALMVASVLPDLADFVLPQGNQCRTSCGLYSHAFPAIFYLALAASGLSWVIWHRRATAFLVGALVIVHVPFDFVTGFKPLWFGGPEIGLYLYRFQSWDFALEATMATIAWAVLRRSAKPPPWLAHPAALAVLIAIQALFDVYHHKARSGWRPPF